MLYAYIKYQIYFIYVSSEKTIALYRIEKQQHG